VFGTIGAIGGNNQGVSGMIPDSSGICYLIARVFDDEDNTQFASKKLKLSIGPSPKMPTLSTCRPE
jgi:hypothetical protein